MLYNPHCAPLFSYNYMLASQLQKMYFVAPIVSGFSYTMREVQNSPVFFISRWLLGLGGSFPVREVQNFAEICISRVRHEMCSVFSLIRDINKPHNPSMPRQLFRHMPRFPARDMHGCCDWSMSRDIFVRPSTQSHIDSNQPPLPR